ncbi:MAG: DUF5709 domain-containing protein [Pseudonocardia sp.]
MSQREYEPQPQAPDLGEYVQEDSAETLTGPTGTDALDAGYVPPDRPYVLDDDQVAPGPTATTENLDSRLRRERPDVTPDDPSGDETLDATRAGRLEPSAPGADGGYHRSMDARQTGVDGGAASAEEAAVHERPEDEVGGVE